MKSWLGSALLLATVLAFGCTRSEPQQAQVAQDKSVDAQPPTVALSTNGADASARNGGISGDAVPKPGAKSGRKIALLVGVTKYDKLDVKELIGPANDVRLMSQMLKDRFGFADQDIAILADGPGASGRPTRDNIKSHFDRLAKIAQAGDQMVILLGGHGDLQPEQEPFDERTRRHRPDGLDPIFLPCDTGRYDEKSKTVVNAIIADQMGVWTKAIADRGASLWLIVDACHSATILRGGGDEVSRALPEGSLVPLAALAAARKAATARGETARGGPDKPAVKPDNQTPKLMALYACQRDQTAPELTLPVGGTKRHGLLTYTVCQVLCEAKTKLTYRDLRDRIQAKYIAEWGRMYSPVPLMEGLDEDTEVLGTQAWAGRSQFLLSKKEDTWTIRAGQLHGLTNNSILAVYPPAGEADADKAVGHVRIRSISATESEVEPWAYAKMPLPKKLGEGGRCALVYAEYGSMGLRVGLEGAGKAEGETHRRARQMLTEIAKDSNALLDFVDERRPADVLVRLKGDKLYLFTAEIAQLANDPPPGAVWFGPYRAEQSEKMQKDLTNIARARNLLKVVVSGASNSPSELVVEFLKFKNKKDKQGEKFVPGPKGFVLKAGDLIGWRITNPEQSRVNLDVTLLFINSQFGITPLFPSRGEGASGINRVRPGNSVLKGPFPVKDDTVGLEHLVMIAVKGDGPPIDFTCLAQPTLAGAQEVARGKEEAPLSTPLGRLLKGAMYGQGTARDLGAEIETDAQAFRLLSWSVQPPKK